MLIRARTLLRAFKYHASRALGGTGAILEDKDRIGELRRRLRDSNRELAEARFELTQRAGDEDFAIKPQDIVWIFGAGRTGSSWLSSMMGEMPGQAVWFEPRISSLLTPDPPRLSEGWPHSAASQVSLKSSQRTCTPML